MTQEIIKERMAIMQAYLDGQTIQSRYMMDDDWSDDSDPVFDWSRYDYRAKPEPSFVPYSDAYEFAEALINHSSGLTLKDTFGRTRKVELIDFTDNTVKVSTSPIRPADDSEWYKLGVLLERFTFTDDTPCGHAIIPIDL